MTVVEHLTPPCPLSITFVTALPEN
jgi:hypothetical protein